MHSRPLLKNINGPHVAWWDWLGSLHHGAAAQFEIHLGGLKYSRTGVSGSLILRIRFCLLFNRKVGAHKTHNYLPMGSVCFNDNSIFYQYIWHDSEKQ
jgi:hypothetical protein